MHKEIIGKAIKGKRDRVFISTKFSSEHNGYENVLKSCDESLKRLGTDYTDLYSIHWYNPKINPITPQTNLSAIELELPESYLDLLVYYVAHKLTTSRDPQAVMNRSPFHVGNNYKALYESELVKLMTEGSDIEVPMENNRFAMNGFC